MSKIVLAVLAASLLLGVGAASAQPSERSIDLLMQIMRPEQTMDSMYKNMLPAMRAESRKALRGEPLNAEQAKILTRMEQELDALLTEEMSWAKLKPDMIRIYRETFTQQEVDDMIAFYSSPSGQSVLQKLPQTMEKFMPSLISRMQAIQPRVRQIVDEATKEMRAAAGTTKPAK